MNRAAPRATARWVGPAVLLLHALALLFAWRGVVAPHAGLSNDATIVLLTVDPAPEQAPPPAPPMPPATAATRDRPRAAAAVPRITPTPPAPAPTVPPAEVAAAIRPDDAASEPLLDAAATQRAIRESVRQPGLAARARDAQGDPPLSSSAKLGNQIEQAAHGDCGKGEYVGAGMGLLSLPFWAAAELRGKCAR